MRRIAYILMVLLMAVGCRRAQAPSTVSVPKVYYKVPEAPAMLAGQERIDDFYARNWWRDFDYSDTTQVALTDTVYMVRLFADWATVLERVPDSVGVRSVEQVMDRASANKKTFEWFVMAAREVLADPNSQWRDDELYMPVLRVRIASPFTDEPTRERLRYRLDILSQNRIGHKANNIRYTLFDGFEGTLYGIKAEFTLVFINNPGCEMCRTVREEICASDLLSRYIASGRLKVLAIYPDQDLDEWLNYRSEMPKDWINGYDRECVMRTQGTYNLTAIPSLYLLDKDKTVLIKDAVSIPLIESALFPLSK
ncbi:MAG: DUF5106 domain-containing protein [Bacteroidaceae bacterium]|nr:DUF5106 domain-containing protein [Bacteroidaceae bacterium]